MNREKIPKLTIKGKVFKCFNKFKYPGIKMRCHDAERLSLLKENRKSFSCSDISNKNLFTSSNSDLAKSILSINELDKNKSEPTECHGKKLDNSEFFLQSKSTLTNNKIEKDKSLSNSNIKVENSISSNLTHSNINPRELKLKNTSENLKKLSFDAMNENLMKGILQII